MADEDTPPPYEEAIGNAPPSTVPTKRPVPSAPPPAVFNTGYAPPQGDQAGHPWVYPTTSGYPHGSGGGYGQQQGVQLQGHNSGYLPSPRQGFTSGQQPGYQPQQQGFTSGQQPGYQPQQQGFTSGQQPGYQPQQQGFTSGQQPGYQPQQQGFTSGQQPGYQPQQQGFTSGQQPGYQPQQQGFTSGQPPGYQPQQQGFTSGQQPGYQSQQQCSYPNPNQSQPSGLEITRNATNTNTAIRSNMCLAVCAMVCCWPVGLVAVMSECEAKEAVQNGDLAHAKEASDKARSMSWISIFVGGCVIGFAVFFGVIVGLTSR